MIIREKISLWAENEPHLALMPIVFFIFGILAYFNLPFEPAALSVLLGIALCIGILLFLKRKPLKFAITLLLFFFLGLSVCLAHTAFIHTNQLPIPLENVRIYGKITSIEKTNNTSYLNIQVDKITKKDVNGQEVEAIKKEFTPQHVRLTTQEENIRTNDEISGFVRHLMPPQMPITPFSTNEARKLWFEGIGATGAINDIKIPYIYNRVLNEESFINKIRQKIQSIVFENTSFENAGVISALILGDTHMVSTSSRLLYRDLGISHVLAVSGFHIGLTAFFIFVLVRFLFNFSAPHLSPVLIKRIALLSAAAISGLYVFISGAHPPAIRSFIMVSATLLALFFDKRAISIRNVFFAAFLILCYKPVLLMDIGFQLSFISVLCLIGICEKTKKYFKARSLFSKAITGIFLMLAFNFSVSLASAPFVLYTFHQIPLYGVIGNLLLSSLFAFAIIPLSFFSLLTAFISPVCIIFLKCVDFLLSLVRFIGMPITTWPHVAVYASYFHSFGLVLWGLGITGLAIFQTKIRYVFFLFLCLAPCAFLNIEKPIAMIGANGKFVGFRQHNTYYETESYYYKKLHQAWLTYGGFNPEKEHILPLNALNSPVVALSEKTCQNAFLYINKKHLQNNCPHQIFPFQLDHWQTILIYRRNNSFNVWRACETDTSRPWGKYCPPFGYFREK